MNYVISIRETECIRTLRTMSRKFSIDVLEDMLEKLRTVTEEKRAEEQAAQAQRAEYQEKINTWLELMADGITPEQLVTQTTVTSKGAKKRQPRPAKYRFTDHTGAENLDRAGTHAEAAGSKPSPKGQTP